MCWHNNYNEFDISLDCIICCQAKGEEDCQLDKEMIPPIAYKNTEQINAYNRGWNQVYEDAAARDRYYYYKD